MGAVFGASETVFGSAGPASFLHKLTSGVAVVFMMTSLGLTYLSAHKGGDSVMQGVSVTTVPEAPEHSKPVETAAEGVKDIEESVDSGEQAGTLTEENQPSEKQPENIAPATTQPEKSKPDAEVVE